MKKKLHRLLVFFVLCQVNAAAQTEGYHYEAAIKPVDSSGFYNIVLTPELNAHLKTDYSDLRIVNDSGKWVPHLVRFIDDAYCRLPVVITLEIVQLTNNDHYTDVILKGTGSDISTLSVLLGNTIAERFCSLAGSDDMKSWFTINDSINIKPIEISGANKKMFTLEFPAVSYNYYRVQIENGNRAPFNIKQVTTTKENKVNKEALFYGDRFENPVCSILQKDSGKISFIRITQNLPYHFNGVALKLSGIKFYNRQAEFYIPQSKEHSFADPGKQIKRFVVSNNSNLEVRFPLTNAEVFYIKVYNDDNPSLKVEDVMTFVNSQVVTAYFEKESNYKILLGNKSASSPDYDLTEKDLPLKEIILPVSIDKLVSLNTPIQSRPKNNSKDIIWISIAIAAIVLAFFTFRLITDMNKSKT
jgi:hypothetical protein